MTNIRLFAVIAGSVIFAALVTGAITRPAHADSPRSPVCTWTIPDSPVTVASEKALIQENTALQAWMASQTMSGATQFILVPSRLDGHASLCAW